MEHSKVSAGALDEARLAGIERSLRALSVPFRWEGAALVVETADVHIVRRVVDETSWPSVTAGLLVRLA